MATGSLDRSCQLWDLVSGSAVRVFTGHKVKFFHEDKDVQFFAMTVS